MRRMMVGFLALCLTAFSAPTAYGIYEDPAEMLAEIVVGMTPYRHHVCDKGKTDILFFTKTEVRNSIKRDYVITMVVSGQFNYFYSVSSSENAFIPRYFVVESKTTSTLTLDYDTFRARLRIETPQYVKYLTTYGQSDCRIAPIPGQE